MAENDAKIGGAYVEITAPVGQLETDLNTAKTRVEAFSSTASASAESASKSVGGIGTSFKNTTKTALSEMLALRQALSAISGAIFGTIGVIGALAAPIIAVVQHAKQAKAELAGLQKQVEALFANNQVRTYSDQSVDQDIAAIEKTRDALIELAGSREFSGRRGKGFRDFLFKEQTRLETDLAALYKQRDRQREEDRRKANETTYDKQRQAVEALLYEEETRRNAITASLLGGAEKVTASYDAQIAAAERERDIAEQAGDTTRASLVNRRIALLFETRELERQTAFLVQAADESERAARADERRAQEAERFRDAYFDAVKASQQLADRQQSGFGLGDLKASLDGLKRSVDSIRGQIR